MSLIHYPGSDHQMAVISIDAGHARDIMLMLTDAHALISDLAEGAAPGSPPCATPAATTPSPAWPAHSKRP